MTTLTPEFWARFLGPPRETGISSSMQSLADDHEDADWESLLVAAAVTQYQHMLVIAASSSND